MLFWTGSADPDPQPYASDILGTMGVRALSAIALVGSFVLFAEAATAHVDVHVPDSPAACINTGASRDYRPGGTLAVTITIRSSSGRTVWRKHFVAPRKGWRYFSSCPRVPGYYRVSYQTDAGVIRYTVRVVAFP